MSDALAWGAAIGSGVVNALGYTVQKHVLLQTTTGNLLQQCQHHITDISILYSGKNSVVKIYQLLTTSIWFTLVYIHNKKEGALTCGVP